MLKLEELQEKRIVSEQMGSWKWQDAYRISTYTPRLAQNGKVLWEAVDSSSKLSYPQIVRLGHGYHDRGSLHNRPVPRKYAVSKMGIARVRGLELRGWVFGK